MRNLWLQMTGHAPEPVWMSVLGCSLIFGFIYAMFWAGYVFGGQP